MNRALIQKLICTGTVLVSVLGCSQSGPNTSTGNAGSSSTSTESASGGAPGAGGDVGMGGAPSDGGASSQPNTASGGATSQDTSATGGSEGDVGGTASTEPGDTGGRSSAGGVTSATGGAKATTGGRSSAGGATSGTGGTKAGTGGATSAGGTTSGATGGTKAATGGTTAAATGGAATGGAATGGSAGITPTDIVPDLAKGFYWEGSCQGSISVTGHNCPMSGTGSSCPSNGIDKAVTHTVKGDTSKTYTVKIEVRGVIGTRCYKGGTRASTAAGSDTGFNNWWYIGGSYDNPTGWWNSYELHVSPATGDASGDVYYFNGSDVGGGTWCEKEATYLVKYTASFKVKGGGTLTFKIHDQNCKAQQNCGSNIDPNSPCQPRTVDLSGMAAQPDSTFKQPPTNALASGTYDPQWMWIVATGVTTS